MTSEQLEQIWADVQRSLTSLVPENVYRIWLEQLRPVALDESALYLEAPDQMLEWLRRRFGTTLDAAVRAVDPLLKRVELLADGPNAAPAPAASAALDTDAPALLPSSARRLNPANTFSEFVIGSGNRFAHAAALSVAELPGGAYNPVFLYGPTGTGKTHLLQAVANYVLDHDPQLKVRYVTAETFATTFRAALRSGHINEFKHTHRSADVLIVDDVGFLDQKKRSTEEFRFTVDDLIASGSQVLLSAEHPPSSLDFLGECLSDRLQSGLVAGIQQPDLPTRLAVLHKRAPQLHEDSAHAEVLEYLARTVTSNLRALEGALIRVHAYASLTQRPLTIDLAQHVLANLDPAPATGRPNAGPGASVERIQRQTCSILEVAESDISSPKRSRQVVYARQVAMYLCRELTPLSLPSIGNQFGGRDHTTVLHAHRKIKQRVLTDPQTRSLVDRIQQQLEHPKRTP